jgi:hypothetical protein
MLLLHETLGTWETGQVAWQKMARFLQLVVLDSQLMEGDKEGDTIQGQQGQAFSRRDL